MVLLVHLLYSKLIFKFYIIHILSIISKLINNKFNHNIINYTAGCVISRGYS